MCGLAGIVSKMPRAFDYASFCTLVIANDSRGGDSCGVFIDGKYEYGVDKNKYFSSYFLGSDLIYNTDRSSVALVHCRKASVGKISEQTAQPVIIKDAYGNVKYVLMHNGTIHNYKELAKKYIPEVDIEGMTDSQVMAHIFYSVGYEPLNEYNGAAVFAIVDYREYTPKVMLFKGASKKTKWTKDIEEERPLYYCVDKLKRELVFSSIGVHLCALRKELDVFSLKENVLVEFNGKGLSIVKHYSRENAFQQKEYEHTGGYYNTLNILPLGNVDTNYMDILHDTNTYSFRGKPLNGKIFLSSYGKIEPYAKKNPQTFEMYFFEGVALKNKYCFRFLTSLRKELRLSDADFFSKFQTVIRYLSIDGVYKKDNMWYKCTSATESSLFTGSITPLCSCSKRTYNEGLMKSSCFDGTYKYIESVCSQKHDINFKTIKEECKLLMK